MERIIIIGGGVAGLSCLNGLLEKGISALLLESSIIGTPKICGEFIAPAAVSALKNWGIGPIQWVREVNFFAGNRNFRIPFPNPAGAFPRDQIELQLAERAKKMGGQIREQSIIKKIIPATQHSPFTVILSSGEEIRAEMAIFATGKFNSPSFSSYVGFKVHFPHIVKPESLYMHSYNNAYLGIVPVSNHISNCAGLIKKSMLGTASVKEYFFQFINTQPTLQRIFKHIDWSDLTWLEGQAPEFGLRKNPNWPNAFWIGDAMASWHPAMGNGVNHSIKTADMIVQCYAKNNFKKYKTIKSDIKKNLWLSKFIHSLLLHPRIGSLFFPFHAWIQNIFFKRLGYYDNSNHGNRHSKS